jgi:hypothetical protein
VGAMKLARPLWNEGFKTNFFEILFYIIEATYIEEVLPKNIL